MGFLRILRTYTLASLATGIVGGTPAQGASDGVEFQVLPIDISQNCTAHILRGTRRFQGTAFLLPKVLLARDESETPLMEIFPSGEAGDHVLRLGLSFPRESSDCNLAQVKTYIARRKPVGIDPITQLVPLPLKGIGVRIDGFAARTKIGSDTTSLIDYVGHHVIVEFRVTKAEIGDLLRRMRGRIGVNLNLDLDFGARSSDGYIKIKLNAQKLSRDLMAGLRARVPTPTLLTAVELRGALQKALEKNQSDIYVEAGESSDISEIATQLTTRIFDAAGLGVPEYGYGGGSRDFDDDRHGDQPSDPGDDPQPMIRIGLDAIARVSSDQKIWDLTYTRLGKNTDQRYTTSLVIRADLTDPTETEEIVGREPFSLGVALAPGQDLHISPLARRVEKILYGTQKTYYSKATLIENLPRLAIAFPALQKARRDTGIRELGDSRAYLPHNVMSPRIRVWGSETLNTSAGPVKESSLESTQALAVPTSVTFSRIGTRRYSLREIASDNANWQGQFDDETGLITLRPKRNLGAAKIFSVDVIASETRIASRDFEEDWASPRALKADGVRYANSVNQVVPRERISYRVRLVTPVTEAIRAIVQPTMSRDGIFTAGGGASRPALH